MALWPVDGDDDDEEERERVEATAKKLLKSFEGLWAGSYEYPPADLSTYGAEWLNTVQKWNIPDWTDQEHLPPEASAEAIAERHAVRLTAYGSSNSSPALCMTSLADLLASEERERTRTRRFRQEQGVPSRIELERMGSEPEFAARVHEAMRRLK